MIRHTGLFQIPFLQLSALSVKVISLPRFAVSFSDWLTGLKYHYSSVKHARQILFTDKMQPTIRRRGQIWGGKKSPYSLTVCICACVCVCVCACVRLFLSPHFPPPSFPVWHSSLLMDWLLQHQKIHISGHRAHAHPNWSLLFMFLFSASFS